MRKPRTEFQELQERARNEATIGADGATMMGGLEDLLGGAGGGADMEELQKMMADAMNDPETRKQISDSMGGDLLDVFDKIQNMDPDELQKQMEEAMNLLTGDDSMIESILEKREEIILQLEKTGAIPSDELAKFKSDPQYFELKMRESFDQMQGLLSDPDYIKTATEALSSIGGVAKDLFGKSEELASVLKESLNDDDKLEEARLEVLKGDNPLMSKLFEGEEMQAILNDPVKWRETVKEGYKELLDVK